MKKLLLLLLFSVSFYFGQAAVNNVNAKQSHSKKSSKILKMKDTICGTLTTSCGEVTTLCVSNPNGVTWEQLINAILATESELCP